MYRENARLFFTAIFIAISLLEIANLNLNHYNHLYHE